MDKLPRWAYLSLSLVCACMGLWASYITLQYFEHGAKALETDSALQALAVSAAVMFVASEMGAFALAALLTERQLWARRWMLTGFAACVFCLEVVTIVAVQLALTLGAEMTQSTTTTQEHDLRARIAAIEASAASKRATADKQRTTARDGYELKLAVRSSTAATEEQAKTDALYQQLALVQAQKRPTLTNMLGRDNAIYYAVARGVLVSLGGLVFFGVSGALLQAARRPVTSVPIANKQAPVVAPPTPSMNYSKTMLAGGALATLSAPIVQAAPVNAPVGALEQSRSGASEQSHFSEAKKPAMNSLGTTEMPGKSETEQAHSSETERAHLASASASKTDAPKRAWTATAVPDGDKLDSAVSGKGATRYNRIRAAIRAGKLKPSMRAIQAAEGGGGIVVRRYLQQLETEGVIIKAGRGYALASKGGAA